MSGLCDDDTLRALLDEMQVDPDRTERLDTLLTEFPDDGRLHFLLGSMLASKGRLIEAHRALCRAVESAPDLAIARFQLGLFQLTSGEADKALETWGRLDRLPDGHYLRQFVDGLRRLIRDDFAGAAESLREGIAANRENPPLNNDMRLLLQRCQQHLGASPTNDGAPDEVASETSLILRQFTNLKNLH